MNPTQAETKQQDANSPGVIALSPAEIEQVAGGNSMPIVARYGDLVYVGPKDPQKIDPADHLGLKDLREPDYLYPYPRG